MATLTARMDDGLRDEIVEGLYEHVAPHVEREAIDQAQAYANRGEPFSGGLFYATSVRESDVGAHVRALEEWIQRAQAAGCTTAHGSFEWLR
ncbi:MAG: hypothetical protein IRZ00_10235 [Gemmatimonadetes bacterium]|nr:hypothetical protein [Gemmatimonadota bacterium]